MLGDDVKCSHYCTVHIMYTSLCITYCLSLIAQRRCAVTSISLVALVSIHDSDTQQSAGISSLGIIDT